MRHCLAVIGAALALSACNSSHDDPPPAIKLVQTPVEVPESARQSCRDLLYPLPDAGGLNEEETTNGWGNDRTAVMICDGRRGGAIAAIDAANALAQTQNGENGDRNEP